MPTIFAVLSAVFPVFLVAGAAYAVRRAFSLDVKTLSTLNLYLLIPCLVFSGLSRRVIEWGLFARYAVALVAVTVMMLALLYAVARLRKLDGPQQSAFLLTQFPNLGNFGLPLVLFAFGQETLPLGILVLVCGSFLQNTLGIYLAQRSRHAVLGAIKRVFHFPMVYAFFLALVLQRAGWRPPTEMTGPEGSSAVVLSLMRAVDLLADAAIPAQLMILGAKIAETRLDTSADVFLAAILRLCAAPVFAAIVAWTVGLNGLEASVFILQVSGPTAVGMAVFGVQFDVKPVFLASAVSWSFLFSMITVPILLYLILYFGG